MLFEKNKNKKRKNRRRPTVIESINQCKLPLIIQSRISLNLCTYFVRSLVRSSASPFVRPPLSRNPNYRSRSWSMDEQRMRLRRRERMRVGPKKYSTEEQDSRFGLLRKSLQEENSWIDDGTSPIANRSWT